MRVPEGPRAAVVAAMEAKRGYSHIGWRELQRRGDGVLREHSRRSGRSSRYCFAGWLA